MINNIGNRNDNPQENRRYIINFIYSPILDSNSIEKESELWADSNDKKNFQMIGIKIK